MAMSVTFTNFGGRVVHENRGGVERDYVRDPLGNTVALVDMSGNVTDTYSYWPYGEIRVHSGTATTQLTFLGTLGYFLDYAAKFYVRARHLRADIARWLSLELFWPQQRPYAYAKLAPATFRDPSGKWPWDWLKRGWDIFRGCLLSGSGAAILNMLLGVKPAPNICDSIASCAAALIGEAIESLFPELGIFESCISGFIGAVQQMLIDVVCDSFHPPYSPCNEQTVHKNPLCYLGDLIGGTLDGCVGGLLKGQGKAWVDKLVENFATFAGAGGLAGGYICDSSV